MIRSGDVTVKIYRTKPRSWREFSHFPVTYFANGKRQLRQFTDFAQASAEATQIAEQKAQGALGAAALNAEISYHSQARVLLAEIEGNGAATALPLVEIIRDYAKARANLPSGVTLAETAQFYVQKHPSNMPRKTVAEVVAEFIADRSSAGCSAVHVHDLEVRLGQFARAFSLPISAVSAPLVQQWIYGLKNHKNGKATAARTKENMIRQIVSLFNFARRQKNVPADLALEMSEIPAPRKQHAPIGIYTAEEMRAMLAAADTAIIPALAIAAFAGLRLAEVSRLDWRDVRLSERLIVVGAENAKTAARRLAPISDNLAAWLKPHVQKSGPVNPCEEQAANVGNALGDRIERAAREPR